MVEHTASLDRRRAAWLFGNYLEALSRSGATELALGRAERFLERTPHDPTLLERLAEFYFDHGNRERAGELSAEMLERFGVELSRHQRAVALYRVGESRRQRGSLEEAARLLSEAAELDPASPEPLRSLAALHRSRMQWPEALSVMSRQLDREQSSEHVALLVEMGELCATHLDDPRSAARHYLRALAIVPGDRRVLVKLTQLYSEQRDWSHLIETLLEIADLADTAEEMGHALATAARVAWHEQRNLGRARELLDRALAVGIPLEGVLEDATELARERLDWPAVARTLEQRIEGASGDGQREQALALSDELAGVLDRHLGEPERAIDVLRAALAVAPGDPRRLERLADLYRRDPAKHLPDAVAVQLELAARDPFAAEPYRALKRLYQGAKLYDGAWCACQALAVLHQANPTEQTILARQQRLDPLTLDRHLSRSDWEELLIHPDVDPRMTAVFALVQPLIVGARERRSVVDAELVTQRGQSLPPPSSLSRAVRAGAALLGVEPPAVIADPDLDDDGALLVRGDGIALVVGKRALDLSPDSRHAAQLAGAQLTYMLPGFYVRRLIHGSAGLKAWLLAAIKLASPRVPIAADQQESVELALRVLDEGLDGPARTRLERAVRELRATRSAVDVLQWATGVDLTADRVGLLICDDLSASLDAVNEDDRPGQLVASAKRKEQLLLYSVSEPYVRLRQRLGAGG